MLTSSTTKAVYPDVDGVQTEFAAPFRFFSAAELAVYLEDPETGEQTAQVYGSDYNLEGVDSVASGNVVFNTAPAVGLTVVIKRMTARTQALDLRNGGKFFAESVERSLDRTVAQIQEIFEALTRVISVSGGGDVNMTLPIPQGGSLIGWSLDELSLQNWTPEGIAAVEIYADWIAEVFTGDGVQTSWLLQRVPGSLGNIDVAVDGRQMLPTIEYSLSGQNIVFVTPPADTKKILVRYGAAAAQNVPLNYQRYVAEDAQTVFVVPTAYSLGTSSLQLFLNGLKLQPGIDYFETSTTTLTLALPAVLGDEVEIYWGRLVNTNVVGTSQIESQAVTAEKLASDLYTDQIGDFRLGNHPADRAGVWVACTGSAISRTAYAALFARIGTIYGTGDGSTTFNVPTIALVSGGAANLTWYIRAA